MNLARIVAPATLAIAALHTAAAQGTIPVRTLTLPLSTADVTFGTVAVRSLSSGNVFVNDTRWHRLYLFDSTLTKYTVVFDSTSGMDNSYGPAPAPLIALQRDTTLMLDLGSQALLVLDPSGKIVRVIAQPSTTNPVGPAAKADNRGRLIYRGRGSFRAPGPTSTGTDSVVLVRANLTTRTLDTVATIKIAGPGRTDSVRGPNGQMVQRSLMNPLPASDDWAVLADGSLAVVRAQDYHIDWVRPDGTRESTPKMPLDWRRLTDAEKERLVDSTRKQVEAMTASIAASTAGRGGDAGGVARGGGGGGRGGGDGAGGGAGSGGPPPMIGVVPVSDVPDYIPPLRMGSLRADLDGNLWIPPVTTVLAAPGEIIYDVINVRGQVFERVRVPIGRTIVGFGEGGVLYLSSGSPADGFRLERVKVRR